MEYNIINKEGNGSTFLALFEECKGKVVITCNNSFVTSSVIDELKTSSLANAGSIALYNGVKCIIDTKDPQYMVIVSSIHDVHELADYFKDIESFYVANLSPTKEDVFVFTFDITPYQKMSIPEAAATVKGESTVEERHKAAISNSINSEIISSLHANNVVFIQNIDDKVLRIVDGEKEDVHVFKSMKSFLDSYESSFWNDCTMVLCFELDEEDSGDLYCRGVISSLLKSGVTFVCNTSWIKIFLAVPAVDDDVNITSSVIYNSNDFGPMGNTVLYTEAASKPSAGEEGIVKVVGVENGGTV